jgi:hypothetical protein
MVEDTPATTKNGRRGHVMVTFKGMVPREVLIKGIH